MKIPPALISNNRKGLLSPSLNPCVHAHTRKRSLAGASSGWLNKLLICGVLMVASEGRSNAADGTWLAGSGSGDWSNTSKWAGSVIADGTGSLLNLEPPSPTGVYTINLDGDRTIGGIKQTGTGWSASNYLAINGNSTLTFAGAGGSTPLIQLSSQAAILAKVAGANGLKVSGGTLDWKPAVMSLTGGIEFENTSVILNSSLSTFGSNNITLAGSANVNFGLSANTTYSNNLILNSSSSVMKYAIYSATTVFNITLSGVISETGGTRSITYSTGTTGPAGGRFIVTGANTYKGGTVIRSVDFGSGVQGPVVVQLRNNDALGTGGSTVTFDGVTHNALELGGGITVSGKALTLKGEGFQSKGSLNNVDGENTWAGNIALGTAANAGIGVEAGRLTVSGTISGNSAGGLQKVGAGTLLLTASNTYSTGTVIKEGTVVAGNNGALGTGGVGIEAGASLGIASGVNLTMASLSFADSSSKLEFTLDGASTGSLLTLTGAQIGSGVYTVNISAESTPSLEEYRLLHVGGGYEASGFVLGAKPDGFQGNLVWADGDLMLNVTAVPEPGSSALLLSILGFGAIGILRRRKLAAQ